jgi:redox-sensing transcriptional repressor
MPEEAPEPISPAVGQRLSRYLRVLETRLEAGRATVRSRELGEVLDLTADQVRKDLSRLGQFGQRGVGYDVGRLVTAIRIVLGTDRRRRAGVIGAGRLGQALALHRGFPPRGFDIEAIFDVDPAVIGSAVGPLTVRDLAELGPEVARLSLEIVLLAVPAPQAQAALEACVAAGVVGVLSFAGKRLEAPAGVVLQHVDLAQELEQLACRLPAPGAAEDA